VRRHERQLCPCRISYLGGGGNDRRTDRAKQHTAGRFAAATTNLTITESNTLTYTNVITDIERPPQTFTWTLADGPLPASP